MKQMFVYIVSNKKHGTLYIGVTSNLVCRIYEHKNKLFEGFTSKYDLTKLVYFEAYGDAGQAIAREKELKKWKREWKIKLIEKDNPNWDDLYSKII
jgi:putative endonuclease